MRDATRAVGLLGLLILGGAGQVRGQDDYDIEIVNRGKTVADIEVLLLVNAGKVDLGASGADGIVTVPADATSLAPGTPVDVYAIECGDTVIVVLVAPGERQALEEECARRRRENPDCDCSRLGGFLWGDDVTIDVGASTVTRAPSTGGAPLYAEHAFADVQVGAIVDYSTFYNWEDVGCDQAGIASCSGDTGVPGVGFYLDYRFGSSPFGLNLEAHYAKLELDQTFQTGDARPIRNMADVNSWLFQSALVYSHGFSSHIAWFGRIGYAVLRDDGEFTSTYASGTVTENRSNTASQLLLGTGLHFPIGQNWCVRTGVDVTTSFDSGNGDENARVSFGIGYRMNRE